MGGWALRGQNTTRVSEEALLGWEEVVLWSLGVGCCSGLGGRGSLEVAGTGGRVLDGDHARRC